jgi:hypothetical protein
MCLLDKFYNTNAVEETYSFSPSGLYRIPKEEFDAAEASYTQYIESLPLMDDVEAFGLHHNANVVFQAKESKQYLEMLLALEPVVSGTADVNEQEVRNGTYCILTICRL